MRDDRSLFGRIHVRATKICLHLVHCIGTRKIRLIRRFQLSIECINAKGVLLLVYFRLEYIINLLGIKFCFLCVSFQKGFCGNFFSLFSRKVVTCGLCFVLEFMYFQFCLIGQVFANPLIFQEETEPLTEIVELLSWMLFFLPYFVLKQFL